MDKFRWTAETLGQKLDATLNVFGLGPSLYLEYEKMEENLEMSTSLLTFLNDHSSSSLPQIKSIALKLATLSQTIEKEKTALNKSLSLLKEVIVKKSERNTDRVVNGCLEIEDNLMEMAVLSQFAT